ncbi:hypothetical protein BS78_03G151700 [Paspalum vaginatum]|nr:hypothetical protein BS78_03G151700 [Paspalum vaginatum]
MTSFDQGHQGRRSPPSESAGCPSLLVLQLEHSKLPAGRSFCFLFPVPSSAVAAAAAAALHTPLHFFITCAKWMPFYVHES